MKFKPLRRYVLPAVLPAAFVAAYAGGEVTLKNSEVVTWDEFVSALNNPTSLKGNVEDVPANDATRTALQKANDKLKAAQDVVEQKKTAKTTAEGKVTEAEEAAKPLKTAWDGKSTAVSNAEGALSTAENDVETKKGTLATKEGLLAKAKSDSATYVQGIIAQKKKAYEEAEAQLSAWNIQMTELNNTVTKLTGDSQVLSGQIDDAKDERDRLQKEYDALPKTTPVTTTTKIVDWLDNVYNAAKNFNTAYGNGKPTGEGTIYYQYLDKNYNEDYEDWEELNIAFTSVEGYSQMTVAEFVTFVKTVNKTAPVAFLSVNMGKNDKGEWNYGTNGLLSVSNWDADSKSTNLMKYALAAVENLTKTEGYYTTTTTQGTPIYDDPDKEKELSDKLVAAQREYDRLKGDRTKINNQITTNNTSITETQRKIDEYTKVADGKPAGTLSRQETLKKAWDDAEKGEVDGLDSYNTAIENAQKEVDKASKAVTDAEGIVTEKETALATAKSEEATAKQAYDDAMAEVKKAEDAVDAAQTAIETAEAAVTAAQEVVDDAEADLQARADELAINNYKTIYLNEDVIANTTITNDFDGTIYGEDHVITMAEGVTLFNNLKGSLVELGVNGNLYKGQQGSSYTNVAVWNGTSGEFYNNKGVETPYEELGKLGFDARTKFGVNFDTNKLASVNDDTRVYNITIAKPTGSQQYYVTEKNGDMKGKGGTAVTIPNNLFAKSATNDLEGIANVYYADGDNFVCDLVEIKDKDNSFFLPDDIIAKELTYNRTFVQGQNAVCLPFVLNADLHDNIFSVCTYDEEDNSTFWFTRVTEDVPANRPALIVAKEEFSFGTLTDVTLAKTPQSQVVEYKARPEDASYSFGLLKSANCTEITNASVADYKIWGLTKQGKFAPSGSDVVAFPAFRMVIYSEIGDRRGMNAPRRIAVRDEKGIEIPGLGDFTTGVDDILVVESTLDITTGQGQIIFTAEADFGKVPVYNLDGAVITVVDVIAGTTTANIEKGIYIVNGKKVMVK